MSERVVLAERRRDGPYELFRSQWADTDRLLRAVLEREPIESLLDDSWTACGQVGWGELVDELSYLTLNLCLRRDGADFAAYLPVWAGIPTGERDQTPANCGALVRVTSRPEYNRLRRRLRQQKARLGVAIERGEITVETAQHRLLAGVGPRTRDVAASARHLLDSE